MKKNPLVSILINNYNYGRFLKRSIDSALEQSYPDTEVIVVDDGSTDNSKEIIASFGNRIISVLKENGGQASAFNAGFAQSHGEILCFLDADDFYYPHKVERIVELFTGHPTAEWIFHIYTHVDADGNPWPLSELMKLHNFPFTYRCQTFYQEATLVDHRAAFMAGKKFIYWAAGPPGWGFRRTLLNKILPMPEAESITLGDRFVQLAALYLSPGLHVPEKLAYVRLHGKNRYGFKSDVRYLDAQIGIKTAFHLRAKFPQFKHHTDKMFASSLGCLLGEVGLSGANKILEYQQYISQYFSLSDWCIFAPRIIFNLLRNRTYVRN